jgi:hypothetical protein
MRLILAALLLLTAAAPAAASDFLWPAIVKDRWSEADERGYEDFVAAIAATDCRTVSECLRAPANPLAKGDPPGLVFSADCADLVYMLRAYYAWKHALPFGFVTGLEARASRGEGDLKLTIAGNRPIARWDVTTGSEPADIREVFRVIRDNVSTATFRVDPRIEHPVAQDFYSPAITRAALRPGSAIYNGDGHVVIVSEVDSAGRIHFIDAHPDRSVTRGIYSGQFQRGDPAIGAGFHAWRPVVMVEGRLAHAANAQLAGFAMEQYFGPNGAADWRAADFTQGGRNIDFVEYTRRRLAEGPLVYDILEEARLGFADLCEGLRDRARFVEDSDSRGIFRRPRPGTLEGVTDEERSIWLVYSTPGRDRRLRTHIARVASDLARFIALYQAGDPAVRYTGKVLRADLRTAFASAAKACRAVYTGSDRNRIELTMRDMLHRLPDMSFDPYHCPERRWGASGGELARCDDDGVKTRWYHAQAPLRGLRPATGMPPNPTLAELAAARADPAKVPDFEAIIETAPEAPPKRKKR